MTSPVLSAIMIVKNEEKNLQRCLPSLKNVVQEILIVDTGSTDKTIEIAQSFGAKVHLFPWNGNESDARNESIKHATGEWLFMIDADEEVSPELAKAIQTELPRIHENKLINSISLTWRNHYLNGDSSLMKIVRIGRKRSDYHFEGPIHPKLNYLPEFTSLNGTLEHYGYMWDPELRKRKGEHLLKHLEPLIQGDHPSLDRFSEYLSTLLIAEQKDLFHKNWERIKDYSVEERLHSPHSAYWASHINNALLYFSSKGDFDSAYEYCKELLTVNPNHLGALFYLLQRAVMNLDWQQVQQLSQQFLSVDQTKVQMFDVIYPESQKVLAKAWNWYASEVLGSTTLPVPPEIISSRSLHILLHAYHHTQKLRGIDPALEKLFQISENLQKDEDLLPAHAILSKAPAFAVGTPHHLLTHLLLTHLEFHLGKTPEAIQRIQDLLPHYASHDWFIQTMNEVESPQQFNISSFYLRRAWCS